MAASWQVEGPAGAGSLSSTSGKVLPPDQYGTGLVLPFRRIAQGDFDSAAGAKLISSNVKLILSTPQGKFPWDPSFGCKLYLLRHSHIDEATEDLARVYISDALRSWEPRLQVRKITAQQSLKGKNALEINVSYTLGRLTDTVSVSL